MVFICLFVLIGQLKSKVMQAGVRGFSPEKICSIHFVLFCFSVLSGALPGLTNTAALGTTVSELQSFFYYLNLVRVISEL